MTYMPRYAARCLGKTLTTTAIATTLMSLVLVMPAGASQQTDWLEQRRYAVETVSLPYEQFIARQSDFRASKCTVGWPSEPGDPPTWSTCTKPPPYNSFDWTDDGCSGREQIGLVSNVYRNLFNQPCRQHDFGYRNFGKGLTLERTEQRRAFIDGRFLYEMKRVCNNSFPRWWQFANKQTCFKTADGVYGAVRVLSNWSAWIPPQPSAPQPTPTPQPVPTPPSGTNPPPAPGLSVTLTKGDSAQGQPGCSSSACRYMVVSFSNFSDGPHTITCRASDGDEGGFYSYVRSGPNNTSSVCYYGFPGRTAWVTVDGVRSNAVVW